MRSPYAFRGRYIISFFIVILTRVNFGYLIRVNGYLHQRFQALSTDSPVSVHWRRLFISDKLDANVDLGVSLRTDGHSPLRKLIYPLNSRLLNEESLMEG